MLRGIRGTSAAAVVAGRGHGRDGWAVFQADSAGSIPVARSISDQHRVLRTRRWRSFGIPCPARGAAGPATPGARCTAVMDHLVLRGWVALAALSVVVVAVEPVHLGPDDRDAVAHILAVQVPVGFQNSAAAVDLRL